MNSSASEKTTAVRDEATAHFTGGVYKLVILKLR